MLTWDDCAVYGQLSSSGIRETQGCESTHSPRGHEGLFYAGVGDGNKLLIASRKIVTPQTVHCSALGL